MTSNWNPNCIDTTIEFVKQIQEILKDYDGTDGAIQDVGNFAQELEKLKENPISEGKCQCITNFQPTISFINDRLELERPVEDYHGSSEQVGSIARYGVNALGDFRQSLDFVTTGRWVGYAPMV
jgi:hypothetical protein